MEALFWVGQVGWIAVLACGAYVSFCYFDLADAESARTVTPDKLVPNSPPARGVTRSAGVMGSLKSEGVAGVRT